MGPADPRGQRYDQAGLDRFPPPTPDPMHVGDGKVDEQTETRLDSTAFPEEGAYIGHVLNADDLSELGPEPPRSSNAVSTIEQIIDQCMTDSEQWFPGKSQDLAFLTLCLAGEVGELANIIKKIERGTHNQAEMYPKSVEETTDIFIYLMNIVGLLGFDVVDYYNQKREINRQRFQFWQRQNKGD
jgi:NTP pyrophosphatase (non-canonical NTP hydrolase)